MVTEHQYRLPLLDPMELACGGSGRPKQKKNALRSTLVEVEAYHEYEIIVTRGAEIRVFNGWKDRGKTIDALRNSGQQTEILMSIRTSPVAP